MFLTDPGDVVFDPFGGSCATGKAAEELGRRWFTSEVNEYYVETSRLRFFPTLNSDEVTDQDPSLISEH